MIDVREWPKHTICFSLSTRVVQIKGEYQQEFKREIARPPYFADLAHHPNKGPKHGPLVPNLDTHPRIFTWSAPGEPGEGERYLTSGELLASLGVDVYEPLCGGRSQSPLCNALAQQPLSKQLMMIGNGVHVPTIASWYLYVLGNMCPKKHFWTIRKQPTFELPEEFETQTGIASSSSHEQLDSRNDAVEEDIH